VTIYVVFDGRKIIGFHKKSLTSNHIRRGVTNLRRRGKGKISY
jgi:hypothetical protein